jgi:hypothetical protein
MHNSHFVIQFSHRMAPILRRLPALGLLAMPLLLISASPAPSIDLSRTSGTPGTALIIHGTGFPPGEIVALYIDQPDPYLVNPPPGPRAGADGTITESVKWPGKSYDVSHAVDPSKPGVHTVCGDTGYPGNPNTIAVKACAQFTVIGASPTPTPLAGSDGGPSLPLPLPLIGVAIVVVLALAIGGQIWLQRQSKT